MTDNKEVENVLFALFAQVQRALSAQQSDQIHQLIEGGSHRQAVEAICGLTNAGRFPMPLQARAMAFKLADRLGVQPADLGLLA
jgi:hypothetical protein